MIIFIFMVHQSQEICTFNQEMVELIYHFD